MEAALLRLAELRREIERLERETGFTGRIQALSETPGLDDSSLRLITEYASDFLSVHAANGDYLFASANAESLFGYQPDELVGTSAYGYFHPDDLARVAADHAGHKVSRPGSIRYRFRKKDGEYCWVETRSRARHSDHGVEQIVAITRDVSVETQALDRLADAEQALLRAQLSAASSRLAGAIGHELNNPLTVALAEAHLMDGTELSSRARQSLRDLQAALIRIRALSAELAGLATVHVRESELDLAATCKRAASLMPEFQLSLDLEPVRMTGDAAKIHQLIHNMVASVAGDGTIPITLACRPVSDRVHLISRGQRAMVGVHADLLSAARGESFDWALPALLARRLCEQMDGIWREDVGANGASVVIASLPTGPGARS
jgi:PAS domain S-box-containing protein